MPTCESIMRACSRLGALVTTDFSQRLLVGVRHITMPLRKETDKVDLVGLTAVDCLEVIIAVYRVESIVIGELLLRDSFLGLQAKDGIDVLLLLDIREGSPSIALVSMLEHTRCETLLYAYHSFLTMGFSQRELRFGAGGPRGPGGAGGAGGPAGARL
jgi:hypothetical protein